MIRKYFFVVSPRGKMQWPCPLLDLFSCPPLLVRVPQSAIFHCNGCLKFYIIYRVCLHCTDVPDLLRSTAVLSKFISFPQISESPFAPSFPKEILPHLCHHLPFARRTGIPFLPYTLSYMLSSAYLPPCQEQSASGLGITEAPRKTAEDDGRKKKGLLWRAWGWDRDGEDHPSGH